MSKAAYWGYKLFPDARDESHCVYVSSRGLLKSCRHHRLRPRSGTNKPPSISGARVRPHDTVYVSTKALGRFATRILPKIKRPFVLVSGDSTVGVNPQEFPAATLNAILESPVVESWYAQNLTRTHDKQNHMPLGMDYHSLAQRAVNRWGPFLPPVDQEKNLIAIARAAPPLSAKPPTGYCNWHFAMNRGSREACMADIDRSALFFEPEPAPRDRSWRKNAEMLFTISPTGAGTDCHRTWEAIALGTIPVIDRTELSPLYATLPVIEVDDWGTVTAEFLKQRAREMLNRRYDFAPMFLGYWKRRLTGKAAPGLEMTLEEFVMHGAELAAETY